MFEKDVEEIANKRCHEIMCFGHCSFSSPKHHRCGEWHREYNCAKEGIEFGYNKAKVEVEEKCKETICNLEMNLASVTERLEELEKANEWHKPSEKLPEECSLVLAYLFEETEPTICEYVVSNQWECLPKRIVFCSNDQIRLWKEIVLPKESE